MEFKTHFQLTPYTSRGILAALNSRSIEKNPLVSDGKKASSDAFAQHFLGPAAYHCMKMKGAMPAVRLSDRLLTTLKTIVKTGPLTYSQLDNKLDIGLLMQVGMVVAIVCNNGPEKYMLAATIEGAGICLHRFGVRSIDEL